jgi:hypothetical protein
MSKSAPLEAEDSPQTPHNTLSTPLGRFIERLTYREIALCVLFVILGAATYFWLTAGGNNGIDKQVGKCWSDHPLFSSFIKCFAESLYFSIITFTTVGYGDLAPLGWGRLVAASEALAGLCLTALLIGKIASERQSALLLLIYTSDQQRRLMGFASDLEKLTSSLLSQSSRMDSTEEDCLALTSGLQAYLLFQSHQGRLADFGNGSALRHLYRTIDTFLGAVSDVFNTVVLAPQVEKALLQVATRLTRVATIMAKFHKDDGSARSAIGAINLKLTKIKSWENTAVTRRRLDQVFAVVPPKPWPKHFHKAASAQLGITNALFRKCMDELIKSRRI